MNRTVVSPDTLASDTERVLQIIVKLGHPEVSAAPAHRNQDQLEQFDVLLQGTSGDVLLANFLDDVSRTLSGDEDNGYYHYIYDSAIIPAGTWSPSFVAVDGSIEFLTTLGVRPDRGLPEPQSWLLVTIGVGLTGALRRRPSA